MTTFTLIPGAGGAAWYWHRVSSLLEDAGHQAIAVDLPADDESAGLPEYAQLVTEAIGGRDDVVLAAQSFGGFTAALVAGAVPLRALVLVNAMIPLPGETADAWWEATGWAEERLAAAERGGYGTEMDQVIYMLHDVPPDVAAAGEPHQRPEAAAAFGSVCDFAGWPDIPVRVVAGEDDRFFPADFQRRVAADRLGVTASLLPGGHLMALSQPEPLAGYLLSVAADAG
jgi:pimeloyl-ACP methyl ester carboxylesterase